MRQREPHVDTPSAPCCMWWIPYQEWDPVPGGIPRAVHEALISTPGPMPCRAAYLMHEHNTADFNITDSHCLTASSDNCFHMSTQSTVCEHQEYRCRRLVPDVSTHSTQFGSPCQCSERPMRLLSVIYAGIQSTPFAHSILMKVLGVPYPIVYSIHVSTQRLPSVYVPGEPM
jgi:hypothetical protein